MKGQCIKRSGYDFQDYGSTRDGTRCSQFNFYAKYSCMYAVWMAWQAFESHMAVQARRRRSWSWVYHHLAILLNTWCECNDMLDFQGWADKASCHIKFKHWPLPTPESFFGAYMMERRNWPSLVHPKFSWQAYGICFPYAVWWGPQSPWLIQILHWRVQISSRDIALYAAVSTSKITSAHDAMYPAAMAHVGLWQCEVTSVTLLHFAGESLSYAL